MQNTNPNPTEKSMIQKKKIMLHKTKEYATDVISTPTVESWEESFDKEFKKSFDGGDMWNWERAKPIKQFISSQIQQAEERENDRLYYEVCSIMEVNENAEIRLKPPMERFHRIFNKGKEIYDNLATLKEEKDL